MPELTPEQRAEQVYREIREFGAAESPVALIANAIAEAEIDAVSAARAEWRPIDSAPKDGTTVLLWAADLRFDQRMTTAYWEDGLWTLHDGKYNEHRLRGPSPTHWMPLPPAPEGEQR